MTKFNVNKYLKVVLGVIGAIFLGAIGSGVWENLLSPLMGVCTELAINIITLGKESFLNSIYEDIAKGFSERYSIELYYTVWFLVFSFFLGYFRADKFSLKKKAKNLSDDEKEKYANRDKKFTNYLLFFLVLILFSLIIQGSVDRYKNRAIIYIEQSIRICSPYLSQKEINHLFSQFASIKTKEDYIALDENLRDIAGKNDKELPDFEIF